MEKKLFKKEIEKFYPHIKIRSIDRLSREGIMNDLFILNTANEKYVAKIYRSDNILKIQSEQRVLELATQNMIDCSIYIKNKQGNEFSVSKLLKRYYTIHRYIEGVTWSNQSLTLKKIKRAGVILAKIHNKLSIINESKVVNINQILKRGVRNELKNNILDLKRTISVINKKSSFIKNIINYKIEGIRERELVILASAHVGIIHGDFNPRNVIENKDKITIIDWENTCSYSYIWEIFRSACYFSNKSEKGIICTHLNTQRFNIFINAYISSTQILDHKDYAALMLMPRYYFLLDPYILTSYYLSGKKNVKKLISDKQEDYIWAENNLKIKI